MAVLVHRLSRDHLPVGAAAFVRGGGIREQPGLKAEIRGHAHRRRDAVVGGQPHDGDCSRAPSERSRRSRSVPMNALFTFLVSDRLLVAR